jgi:hypothetical protein
MAAVVVVAALIAVVSVLLAVVVEVLAVLAAQLPALLPLVATLAVPTLVQRVFPAALIVLAAVAVLLEAQARATLSGAALVAEVRNPLGALERLGQAQYMAELVAVAAVE